MCLSRFGLAVKGRLITSGPGLSVGFHQALVVKHAGQGALSSRLVCPSFALKVHSLLAVACVTWQLACVSCIGYSQFSRSSWWCELVLSEQPPHKLSVWSKLTRRACQTDRAWHRGTLGSLPLLEHGLVS